MDQPAGAYTLGDPPTQPDSNRPLDASHVKLDASGGPVRNEPPLTGPNSPDGGTVITGAAGRGDTGEPPGQDFPPALADAGVTNPPPEVICRANTLVAERRRLDMYIVMDSNFTLPVFGVWDKATEGLRIFVEDPLSSGMGVGIRYFGDDCDPEAYVTPEVAVNLLPGNATKLAASPHLLNASLMLPALQGAIKHAFERAKDTRNEGKQIVVVVSDGLTTDFDFSCLYSPADLEDAAHRGYTGVPSVETHVIGIGVTTSVQPLDEVIARFGSFDTIADAGGSGKAITTGILDNAAAFSDALQQVRRNAAPCEFSAPTGVAADQFGVGRYSGGDEVPRVANAQRCRNEQGWYYDAGSAPHPVTMCPATCSWLRESDDRDVRILTGCPPMTRN